MQRRLSVEQHVIPVFQIAMDHVSRLDINVLLRGLERRRRDRQEFVRFLLLDWCEYVFAFLLVVSVFRRLSFFRVRLDDICARSFVHLVREFEHVNIVFLLVDLVGEGVHVVLSGVLVSVPDFHRAFEHVLFGWEVHYVVQSVVAAHPIVLVVVPLVGLLVPQLLQQSVVYLDELLCERGLLVHGLYLVVLD